MRIRDEAEMQGEFTSFLKSSEGLAWLARATAPLPPVAAFELKVAHVHRTGVAGYRFGQMEDHQEVALARVDDGSLARVDGDAGASDAGANVGRVRERDGSAAPPRLLVHKISDSAMGMKPFDCFAMTGASAFVVVGFIRQGDGSDTACYAVPWAVYAAAKAAWAASGGRESLKEDWMRENGLVVPLAG